MATPSSEVKGLADIFDFIGSDSSDLGESLQEAYVEGSNNAFCGAIDTVLKGGGLLLNEIKTLQLIKSIGELANWDDELLRCIFKREERFTLLSQIALKLYYDESLRASDAQILAKFKSGLWVKEPIAVLLGAVRAKKLLAKHELRHAIELALEKAVDGNLSIVSAEFRKRILFDESKKPVGDVKIEEQVDQNRFAKVEADKVYGILKALQRLHCLVVDPRHIDPILNCGLQSANDIASTAQSVFVINMGIQSDDFVAIEEEAARRIHNHATAIDCRNQETWVNILTSIKSDFDSINGQPPKADAASKQLDALLATPPSTETKSSTKSYNLTDIFDLQSSQCEDCCSVTGPSAYFVDLLKFLGSSMCTSEGKKFNNVLDALAKRRPDLLDLQLTCANSTNMLPYIAIVNEVLESFIENNNGENSSSLVAVNETTKGGISTISPLDNARTTSVFQNDIATQMFPLNVFPFNLALDATRTFLDAIGLSRLEVLSIFRSEASLITGVERVLPQEPAERREITKAATNVWRRALMCESLGLQPLDLAAIARETVFPRTFLDMVAGLRSEEGEADMFTGLDIPSTCGNWGYESTKAMLDVNENDKAGLGFIRAQLMPRSGLSFQEVLDLTDTLWFGRRLVITNDAGTRVFRGQLSEMRLMVLDATVGPGERGITPLTEEVCHELQGFIRLKNRLDWSIQKLDTVISALAENMVANGVINSIETSRGITFQLLQNLSHAIELSRLVGIPVSAIVPLWSTLSTHGKGSVYETTFLGPATTLSGDDVFRPHHESGKYFEASNEINSHIPALQTALKRSPDELYSLISACGWKDGAYTDLDMETLSSIYRHSTMCNMLNATPQEYLQIVPLLPRQMDIFQDPETTLEFVRQWWQLSKRGWITADIIVALSSASPVMSGAYNATALALTSSVSNKLRALETEWSPRIENEVTTPQDIVDLCTQLYDARTAKSAVSFIECSGKMSATLKITSLDPMLLRTITLPANISTSIDLIGGVIIFTLDGILSQEALKEFHKKYDLKPDTTNAPEKNLTEEELATNLKDRHDALVTLELLLDELSNKSNEAKTAISSRLCADSSETERNNTWKVLDADIREQTEGMSGDEKLIKIEMALKKRRTEFAKLALPMIKQQATQEALVKSIGDSVLGLESTIITMLITSPVIQVKSKPGTAQTLQTAQKSETTKTKDTTQSALKSLQDINFLEAGKSTDQSTGFFFCPKASDWYRFTLISDNEPTFSINSVKLPLKKTGSGWQSDLVMMSTAQSYLLSSSANLGDSSWMTNQSTSKPFASTNLIPASTVTTVASVLETVERLARLVKKLGLGLEEFKYMTTSGDIKSMIQLNLDAPSLSELCALQSYQDLRDSVANDAESFVHLLGWLSNPPAGATMESLVAELSNPTIWPHAKLALVLDVKYTKLEATEIMPLFKNISELVSLQAIMRTSQTLDSMQGSPLTEPVLILFDIATPSRPAKIDRDFKAASSLQLCLAESQLAHCTKAIREKQRTALVQFLLRQPYVKQLGIEHEDGLFEYFMIDVQMGAQLETTRMKQAISTVQLFVHQDINQEKWAWMQRHNTWQATRRAYLYPENWIDPSLRDDKTPLFDEFETNIMQKDLSWDTFTRAIRQYVQGLNTIADLDIQTYIREYHEGVSEIYHFFARTRSSPYDFYYRKMHLERVGNHSFWTPWTKIDIDIMTHEVDWDGNTLPDGKGGSYLIPVVRNGRLFLYLPQIIVRVKSPENAKAAAADGAGEKKATFRQLAEKAPNMANSPCVYEVRMGWTELVDGQWTPKRISQSRVTVEWKATDAANGLPSISNLIFESVEQSSGTIINVGCWRTSSSFSSLGSFEINDERVFVPAYASTKQVEDIKHTMSTVFQKYNWNQTVGTSAVDARWHDKSQKEPLLATTPGTKSVDLTWIISPPGDANGQVTGFVVDEKTGGANGESVFMYPAEECDLAKLTSATFRTSAMREVMEHQHSTGFMETVCNGDNTFEELFTAVNRLSDQDFGKSKQIWGYHELATSYAIYNWELGLHTILMAVDRFHATQQFDLALRAARLIFDPTASPLASGDDRTACWKFRPFRELASMKGALIDKFVDWPDKKNLDVAVMERRKNPSITHATARGRPQAYMKWIVMKYIQILVSAGDVYFRQGSLETLPLGIQRYVEAAHVLGPAPPKMPKLGKPVVRTWNTLGKSNMVELELDFPFLCEVEKRGTPKTAEEMTNGSSILGILRTSYFCLPPNPQYDALRTLVNDRLYKTRNNLDINGRPIVYSMMEPYIDPGQMARALQGGGAGGISSLLNDSDSPMPYQRFSFLIGKALELCSELRSMGDQFLQAKEKQDFEAFSLLKARQDTVRQKMQLDLKAIQREEIIQTLESMEMNRNSAVAHLKYYLQLIGEPLTKVPNPDQPWDDLEQSIDAPVGPTRMTPSEIAEAAASVTSMGLNIAAAGMESAVGGLRAIPNVTTNMQPMGCGVSVKADAGNVAEAVDGAMKTIKILSIIASEVGSQAARYGNLTRQLQERRMQANLKGQEIKSIDKQIEIHKKRLDIHTKEVEIQTMDISNAVETELWYRSKYTSEKLYTWMENSLRAMHYDLYNLTADLCRRAERAFRFEKGPSPLVGLRPGGYWDSGHDGLLAAQQLQMSLRQLESAYLMKPSYDFELVKTVSLRQLDPLALITLREMGTTTFTLPELLFDLDFPGHYMRRLRSVSVSIPCVIGPYTTLAATLSLTEHRYRVNAAASDAERYLQGPMSNGDFRNDSVPISQVAISSGMQDSGTFELSFREDSQKFQPFEGAGAISSWKLELPPLAVRQFDYNSISDVVLQLRYTAVDGGPMLKRAATLASSSIRSQAEQLGASEGLWGLLDVKNELSNEWYSFRGALNQPGSESTGSIELKDALISRLPFWARGKTVVVESLSVVVSGNLEADKALTDQVTIKALGELVPFGRTPLGDKTVFKRAGMKFELKGDDWKLVVKKSKGSEIRDILIYFRYFLKPEEPKKP
ncbi:hypothetical protein BKA56DRAFT_614112 [Ilyonectria sp. MPI-CAGE-AT-0026]|nr:hypothetical protein BKA56DRAFT_614112 [Ilyonectria sp. MPI-CAGE-AT-0026]